MTIQTANAIVQRIGPCRIAIDRQAFPDVAEELALAGCHVVDEGEAADAAFLSWSRTGNAAAFAAALPAPGSATTLVLHGTGGARATIETVLFGTGWRRHPAGMAAAEYPGWTAHGLPDLSYWQSSYSRYEGLFFKGLQSDPVIARYAAAAQHARAGDRLLIDGIAAADGADILLALSRAGSAQWVDEATGPTGGARVDPSLAGIADHSIDLIVALEPAVPEDWVARLDDYARVLRHDGRIVLGWQASANDPTRPDGWQALADAAAERFLPEGRYVQIPTGADGARAILPVALEQPAPGDWLMLVASANPLLGAGRTEGYDHPAYPAAKGPLPALVDFAAAYDNPWLYRTMVQMGERLNHEVKLARLAECVIEDAAEDSADRGAAIAVLGYRVLEMRRADLAPALLDLIDGYCGRPLTEGTPVHVRRWRISLAFLAGRLNELTGDREAARRCYRAAAEADWRPFSPLLATKAIAAAFYEARLHLAEGDAQTALACFRQGTDIALEAARFPHEAQFDADGQPLPFYLQELAEVIDMGSQCANALAHFPLWRRDPGLFWRQVDVRRFGLASWARDLERENARLRAAR